MQSIESEGKTIAEAVDNALRTLKAERDEVEVEVVQDAASGFLGLGAKPARVRVARKQPVGGLKSGPRAAGKTLAAPAGAADTAAACRETDALLEDLLKLMGLDARPSRAQWDPVQERVRCAVDGPDAARLTASEGRALEALQFLSTLIVGRKTGAPVAVQVDALGYWDKREQQFLDQAQRGVEQVRATGKPCRLQPMEPAMRRLIHRHFMNHPQVETASEGEGSWRKIVIRPRKS